MEEHSTSTVLLSAWYMQSTVLGVGVTAIN